MGRRVLKVFFALGLFVPVVMATLPLGTSMVLCIDAMGHLALERPHQGGHRCGPEGRGHVATSGHLFEAATAGCLDLPIESVDGAREPRSKEPMGTEGPGVATTDFCDIESPLGIDVAGVQPLPVLQKSAMLRALSTVVLLL